MTISQAEATIQRITQAMGEKQTASVPELVKLIHALAQNALEVTVDELSELIQKDPIVLTKVIAAANTLGYNPSMVQVTTVTQAIHVIGYNRIRMLAMSLLLIEQAERSMSNEERRESASLALCSGLIAQTLAEQAGGGIDHEQAFISGSLRNFGRIVLSTYMLEEYTRARELAAVQGDSGYVEVLGLTPLDLGYELLKSSHLPEDLLSALHAYTPSLGANADRTPANLMVALADFSVKLSEQTLNPALSASEYVKVTRDLSARYKGLLTITPEVLSSVLNESGAQMGQFMRGFGLSEVLGRNYTRVRQRIAGKDFSGVAKAIPKIVVPGGTASGKTQPPLPPASRVQGPSSAPPLPVTQEMQAPLPAAVDQKPASSASVEPFMGLEALIEENGADVETDHLKRGMDEMEMLVNGKTVVVTKLFELALQLIVREFACSECWLFAENETGGPLILQRGSGALFDVRNQPSHIGVSNRDVMGLCLTRHENVVIHDAREQKILPHLPLWLRGSTHVGSFILLPVFNENGSWALILAGWPRPQKILFPPERARVIRNMLALLNKGLRVSR